MEYLVCERKKCSIGTDHEPVINITTYEEIEHVWMQKEKSTSIHTVKWFSRLRSIYGENCFETICQLMKNEYDVPCLWHIIAHNFCNAIMHNDSFALNYIEKYMKKHAIIQFPRIVDWYGYIIQLTIPL